MPVTLLERIPVPSLQTYTIVSCSLFTCALAYAHHLVTDGGGTVLPFLRGYFLGPFGFVSDISEETPDGLDAEDVTSTNDAESVKKLIEGEGYATDVLNVLLTETWCVWIMVNMAYCCLILLGKAIQKLVFGKLRVIENQRWRDKFWNFVFYKFIFVFGVMNVQHLDETVCWAAWFSFLGFLHVFSQLCKDRFEYLSFGPTTPNWQHVKVLGLLIVVQLCCGFLTAICVLVSFHAGANTFAFMVAECLLLGLKTLHVLARYSLHLYDLHHEGVWENRGIIVYYLEFSFEMTGLTIDFLHHLHMLVWGNIFLSMASLVICMQLRFLFHEFQRRWRRHKNYLRVVNNMEARFPMATPEELEANNDECAICWERMECARKLECGHLFHNACLRSWLEQETSCPICRASLGEPPGEARGHPLAGLLQNPEGIPIPPLPVDGNAPEPRLVGRRHNTTNHFFHFDASRYISWLPSFSVEVTHTQFNALRTVQQRVEQLQTSMLDGMVRQVQDVFPNLPSDVIMADLRLTRSVEITIENIIEGRLYAPSESPEQETPRDADAAAHQGNGEGPDDGSSAVHEPVAGPSTSPAAVDTDPLSPPAMAAVPGELLAASPPAVPAPAAGLLSGGINLNLNFFTDDNLAGLSSSEEDEDEDEEETESSEEDEEEHLQMGSRFSKSSSERQSILEARKESLLAHAKRKYLSKHGGSQQETAEDSAAQSSKQELDCSEADNQANALLERRNQQERDTVSGERDSDSESESSSEHFHENVEDADSRREVMLRAVQRRLQQQ